MRPLFLILTISFFFEFSNSIIAQDRVCGNEEYQRLYGVQKTRYEDQTLRTSALNPVEGVITIPIVVHVIYNNQTATNISDEQIYSQIKVLNEDFRREKGTRGYNTDSVGADVEINFCLASVDPQGNFTSGINRVYNSTSVWMLAQDRTLKSLSYWPSDQYLNVWVVNLSSQYLAYSQFPQVNSSQIPGLIGPYAAETDGIVVHHEAFGITGTAKSPYNYGRTLTHETGHWLGLLHIWGDAYCGDDYVDDTPQDAAPNNTRTCSDSSDCDHDGKYSRDMTNNYLDYSYDKCMNIFTKGQKSRMRKVLELNPRRNALLASGGCNRLTGVFKEKGISKVLIFPNPASDLVNVNFLTSSTGRALLVNEMNQQVFEMNFSAIENLSIPLHELPSGLYFLILETENWRSFQKVIKK